MMGTSTSLALGKRERLRSKKRFRRYTLFEERRRNLEQRTCCRYRPIRDEFFSWRRRGHAYSGPTPYLLWLDVRLYILQYYRYLWHIVSLARSQNRKSDRHHRRREHKMMKQVKKHAVRYDMSVDTIHEEDLILY